MLFVMIVLELLVIVIANDDWVLVYDKPITAKKKMTVPVVVIFERIKQVDLYQENRYMLYDNIRGDLRTVIRLFSHLSSFI